MMPPPSLMVTSWLAGTDGMLSHSPLGHRTLTSAFFDWPKPKCKRESFEETKLDWLCTSCIWLKSPLVTTTRAPMALRLDFVPTSLTFSQELFHVTSFLSSE